MKGIKPLKNLVSNWFGSDASTINYRVTDRFDEILASYTNRKFPQVKSDDSILFVRLSAIGDVVRVLPVQQYLRENKFTGTIGWAVHPPCDDLLMDWPGINSVHTITREKWWQHPLRLLNELKDVRNHHYNWVFDFHSLLKSSLVVLQAKNGRKVGFAPTNSRELNYLFQDETINPLPRNLPRILKCLALVRPYTADYRLRRSELILNCPNFSSISPAVKSVAQTNPVLLHPRTSHARYGQTKEWPPEKFIRLIERSRSFITSEGPVLVTWGPDEKSTAETISDAFGELIRPAPETDTLRDLFYLIDQARLVISGDTAPCHISDVLGTPLLALFGGSDHYVSGPLFTNYRLITTRSNEDFTKEIPVERVLKALKDLDQDLKERKKNDRKRS